MVILLSCTFAFAHRQLPYLDGARNSPLAQLDFAHCLRVHVRKGYYARLALDSLTAVEDQT